MFVLCAFLAIQFVQAQSPSFTLPTSVLDSMVWEVRKGRQCDTALNFALQTIEQKNALIAGQGKLIDLRAKEVATLQELDRNSGLQRDNLEKTFNLDKSILKTKIKKKNRTILGLSGLSAVLLAILIL